MITVEIVSYKSGILPEGTETCLIRQEDARVFDAAETIIPLTILHTDGEEYSRYERHKQRPDEAIQRYIKGSLTHTITETSCGNYRVDKVVEIPVHIRKFNTYQELVEFLAKENCDCFEACTADYADYIVWWLGG